MVNSDQDMEESIMLKHIVFWKIYKDGTEAERCETMDRFSEMMADLRRKMPEIQEARVGYNILPGNGFHICFDSVFLNREDLEAYINHPDHLKIRAFMDRCQYEKTIFDYEY